MAVIELQIATERFADFVTGEINSRPLPADQIHVLGTLPFEDCPLERIRCLGCTVEPQFGTGQIQVTADLAIGYYPDLSSVFAAGSLQPPESEVHRMPLPLTIKVDVQGDSSALVFSAAFSAVSGRFPIALPEGLQAKVAGVVADQSVVAIRIGTQADDPVNTVPADSLAGREWMQLVPGQVFADLGTAALEQGIVAATSDQLAVASHARGQWSPFPIPQASAQAQLVAIDQCPLFGIDIDVDIFLNTRLALAGTQLTISSTLSWDADSTLCDIVGGLLFAPLAIAINIAAENGATEKILGLASAPTNFEEVARDDESVTYQRAISLTAPSAGFSVDTSAVTAAGLQIGGALTPRSGFTGPEGEVVPPTWGFKISCSTPGAGVRLNPATVTLRAPGLGAAPTLYAQHTLFIPPKAWVAEHDWFAGASGDLHITFKDPPDGRLPVGTATAVILFTDCGVRRVDLGTVPADNLSDDAMWRRAMKTLAEEYCGAIHNPFTTDTTKIDWTADPLTDPDPTISRLRLWTIGARGIPDHVTVEFVAVAADRPDRTLGQMTGQASFGLRLVTAADEVVAIKTSETFAAPALSVTQTWISPIASIPLARDRLVGTGRAANTFLIDRGKPNQLTEVRFAGSDGFEILGDVRSSTALRPAGANQLDWALSSRLDRRTIVVRYGDDLIAATMA